MMLEDEDEYVVNDHVVSERMLMDRARREDNDFASQPLKTVGNAIQALRRHGVRAGKVSQE